MTARWRKQPREQGLEGVVQLERGYELREDGKTILSVGPVTKMWGREITGWMFSGSVDGQYVNTFDTPAATKEEAKAQADAWYKAHRKSA